MSLSCSSSVCCCLVVDIFLVLGLFVKFLFLSQLVCLELGSCLFAILSLTCLLLLGLESNALSFLLGSLTSLLLDALPLLGKSLLLVLAFFLHGLLQLSLLFLETFLLFARVLGGYSGQSGLLGDSLGFLALLLENIEQLRPLCVCGFASRLLVCLQLLGSHLMLMHALLVLQLLLEGLLLPFEFALVISLLLL